MDSLYILISILIGLLLLIVAFNYIFTKYYTDPTDSYILATLTNVISLTVGFCCVLLIPIDIFLTSYKGISLNEIKLDRVYFENVMFSTYGIALIVAFVLIPFAYFYGDEKIEDIQATDNDFKDKICNSLKYTLFFIFFCVLMMICGLSVKQGGNLEQITELKSNWINNLFDTEHKGEQAISFIMSIFGVVGMSLLILYTGYGLGALPFYLIKGKKSLMSTQKEYQMDKAEIRERIRNLQEKMTRKGLSNKEKKEVHKLRADEEHIDKRLNRVTNLIESEAFLNKILVILTPFRVIIGFVFLGISILILVSLVITSFDRYLHSKCGLSCGYILDNQNYTNYIDQTLLYLSKHFHLDYLLFALLNIFVYICSIYGFIKLGIKLFCFTWFEIRKKSTNPQGLLIMSFMIIMMIIAFMMEMFTLAPQYSTFGTQTYKDSNGKEYPCSLNKVSGGNDSACAMTNLSQFYNRISLSLPFFSTIFYVFNWLLIVVLLISLIYSAYFRENIDLDDDEDEELMGDEERGLLKADDN